jgi:hypothetical protein
VADHLKRAGADENGLDLLVEIGLDHVADRRAR